jgi:hypothetical protein
MTIATCFVCGDVLRFFHEQNSLRVHPKDALEAFGLIDDQELQFANDPLREVILCENCAKAYKDYYFIDQITGKRCACCGCELDLDQTSVFCSDECEMKYNS